MTTTNSGAAATEITVMAHTHYENGPEGMQRVKRMSDSVLECLIEGSIFRYLANRYEGEDRDRLHGLMHDVAEEVLARVPTWPEPAAATQATSGEALKAFKEAFHRASWEGMGYDEAVQAGLDAAKVTTPAPASPAAGIKTWLDRVQDSQKHGPAMVNEFAMMSEIADLRAALAAAQAQPAPAEVQLSIGVAATAQGTTISIIQPLADGSATVIYGATHPIGDSMGLATLAAAPAAPAVVVDGKTIRDIAEELELEASNYEGDFADTVNGCAAALHALADAQPAAAAPVSVPAQTGTVSDDEPPLPAWLTDSADEAYKMPRARLTVEFLNYARTYHAHMMRKLGDGARIKYTPGNWFEARTLDEMQAFYLSRLPAIREAAKEHGYAIGLHGSQRRDFDLMAMQWREDASDRDTLAHAIAVAACGITRRGDYDWEQKPNGRFAVSLPICWTDDGNPDFDKPSVGHIDLSVIDAKLAQARAAGVPDGAVPAKTWKDAPYSLDHVAEAWARGWNGCRTQLAAAPSAADKAGNGGAK